MGGMVLETNMSEILTRVDEQNKLEKQEVCIIRTVYCTALHCTAMHCTIVNFYSRVCETYNLGHVLVSREMAQVSAR